MNFRNFSIAILCTGTLAACGEPGDAIVDPVQPDAVDASKADGLDRDVVPVDTNEELRSAFLRSQLCDEIGTTEDVFAVFHQRDAFQRNCAEQHNFTVTSFYSSTNLQDRDGRAALVAMDVLVETTSPEGFAFATRLIRDRDDETLALTWRGVLLDTLATPADGPAPGVSELNDVIDAVQGIIGYPTETELARFFEQPAETAEEPETVLEDLERRVRSTEDNDPELQVAWGDWMRVVDTDGELIGYMCPTTDFYPRLPWGDEAVQGTLYFYDVDETFVDAVMWSY